ncbi:MAG: hypothetical protein M3R50_04470 [Bacteroidota bacterium]|nr:hypothetical protein [Bacteroidota bacterium]
MHFFSNVVIDAMKSVVNELRKNKTSAFTEPEQTIADIILLIQRRKENNSDSNLEVIAYNDEAIRTILTHTIFKHIFFTSKFVEKHFLKIFPGTKNGKCLPSPSPRFARMSKAEKIETSRKMLPGNVMFSTSAGSHTLYDAYEETCQPVVIFQRNTFH